MCTDNLSYIIAHQSTILTNEPKVSTSLKPKAKTRHNPKLI